MSYNFKCHTCRLDYSRMVIKLGSQQNGKTDEWKETSAFYCFFFPSESKKTPFCVWITSIHMRNSTAYVKIYAHLCDSIHYACMLIWFVDCQASPHLALTHEKPRSIWVFFVLFSLSLRTPRFSWIVFTRIFPRAGWATGVFLKKVRHLPKHSRSRKKSGRGKETDEEKKLTGKEKKYTNQSDEKRLRHMHSVVLGMYFKCVCACGKTGNSYALHTHRVARWITPRFTCALLFGSSTCTIWIENKFSLLFIWFPFLLSSFHRKAQMELNCLLKSYTPSVILVHSNSGNDNNM